MPLPFVEGPRPMGEANLARMRDLATSTDQPRERDMVMRRAEGPLLDERTVGIEQARDRNGCASRRGTRPSTSREAPPGASSRASTCPSQAARPTGSWGLKPRDRGVASVVSEFCLRSNQLRRPGPTSRMVLGSVRPQFSPKVRISPRNVVNEMTSPCVQKMGGERISRQVVRY
jgi:hypothetical protein